MSTKAIVCDSSVIRGMSNDPRNICYHYRHHLTDKQVYHCELSSQEVVAGLVRDHRISRDRAEFLFSKWRAEFKSKLLSLTERGRKSGTQIQKRLSYLGGLIPTKTVAESQNDCLIAGEAIAQGIAGIAAHDRDFLFIEVVCGDEVSVVMLEFTPDGLPRQRALSNQHKQRLVERLETAGIDLAVSVTAG